LLHDWPAVDEGALAVETRDLAKRYGTLVAVQSISLAISPGEIVGVLGPNGAGKTTLLRMLCGLVKPSGGAARICGIDIVRDPERAKARLGYLDEEPFVYPNLTGAEFLDFVADLYDVPRGPERKHRIDGWLDFFELAGKRFELIGSYSHGMRQKIGLASLLVHEPDVLLLDEPTNGLDPRSARRVKDLLVELSRRRATVILSTHILEVAQALASRVAIMNRGAFVALGSLDEIRAKGGAGDATLEELFLQLTGGPDTRELIEHLVAR
jgi:ABC-2 type transport system ATP-binding protein